MTVQKKPATKPTKPADPVTDAIAGALARMIGIVETIALAGAGSGAAQGTTGAVGSTQGSSQQHTGASHKNDVSAPEITESYNLSGLNDNSYIGKVNARTFDITSAVLNTAMMGHVNSMNQQQSNVTTHADEEFSARKRATEMGLITLGDATEEAADDTDRA
jgi:hypothetical protein